MRLPPGTPQIMPIRTTAIIEEERAKLVDGLAQLKERLATETDERVANRHRKDIARTEQHLARYHSQKS